MNPKTSPKSWQANLALLLAVLIWGSSFILVKDLLKILTPAGAVGLRFLMAAPLFLVCLLLTRQMGALWRHAREGIILSLPLVVVFETQTIGMLTTSASNSAFITGMSVVFTPLTAWAFLRVRPVAADGVLAAVSLLGMAFLTLDFAGGDLRPRAGDLLTLGTAFGQAFHIVMTHRLVRNGANGFALLFWQFLMVALVSLGSSVFFGGLGDLGALNNLSWGAMIYLAIFPAFLTYLIQTEVQTQVEPMHLALMYSLEPIFASLFSWYFTLEAFGPIRLTGAALLLGTCVLSEWLANKRRQKAALVQADATI